MSLFKKSDDSFLRDSARKSVENLKELYSNKSSDEFKCKGDITKSPQYDKIENCVSYLSSIKRYPDRDTKDLKTCFNTLHRPIFAKCVNDYLKEPTDRNTLFTMAFTLGYRLLIGELARVFASTEATEHGLIYKPDKISRKENAMAFVRRFNNNIDKELDEIIKKHSKKVKPVQEAASALGAVGEFANSIVLVIEGFFGFINNIFSSAKALNPVALISAILSRSYDKKIEKFSKISKEYEEAKKAYDEYKKIPASQRKKRIEHNYVKMIEKYNIKMQNLKAQIDHYDLRAKGDASEKYSSKSSSSNKSESNNVANNADNLPSSSSTVDSNSTKSHEDFDF